MGDILRLAVGVMGNAASLLLFSAPILTFYRVIRKKSTEEFSCVPYTIALLNCLLYTWYALPVVSYRWENFPVATINGLGILFEFSFILIYFWFTSAKGKASYLNFICQIIAEMIFLACLNYQREHAYYRITTQVYTGFCVFQSMLVCVAAFPPEYTMKVAITVIPVILVFCITTAISAFAFHDHRHRKMFVGSIGLVAAVAMYGSPLVVVKQVIKTKSVEYMPFYLSFFSFLASSLWMAYGLLSHDLFLASPNIVGSPLGILQLVLYCKYRKRGIMEEPDKWDLEKNKERSKQLQLVINDSTNDKSQNYVEE